jgi:peptide/nickel transport system substrate-binding protein
MSSRQGSELRLSPQPLRRSRRRTHLAVIALALVGLTVAACGGGSTSGGGGTGAGGSAGGGGSVSSASKSASGAAASGPLTDELTIATPSLPTSFSFDAGGGSGLEFQEFLKLNNATLVRNPYIRNKDKNLVQDIYHYEGYLADSYETSADGLTITFHLRKGIVSPAGNEFKADDVIYTFERRYATPTSAGKAVNFPYITEAAQMKKVDDYTVAMTLRRTSDAFTVMSLLSNIANYIYDSVLLKSKATTDDPYAVQWSKTNANHGYGPYILDSFVPDQQMVLHANPKHPAGEPKIKKLTFKVVTDPGSRANALRSGDADVASALRPADQVTLAKDSKTKVYDFDTNSYLLWSFVTTHPPFDDKRVRQALAYAVPYQQIIDGVYAGSRAKRSVGILQPDAPGYSGQGLTKFEYDPKKAKALLADAGKKDGVKFKLTVSNAVPDVQEAAVLIQSYAKDAGFDIQIEQVPPAAYAAARYTYAWDANMYRDYAITLSPPYELYLFFKPAPAPNASGWRPPAYYEILDRGIAAGDPLSKDAGAIWNEAQRFLLDEVPMVFVVNIQPLNGFRSGVVGCAWRSDNLIDYYTLSATKK